MCASRAMIARRSYAPMLCVTYRHLCNGYPPRQQRRYLAVEPLDFAGSRVARIALRMREVVRYERPSATPPTAQLLIDGEPRTISGQGNGPIDDFVHALGTGINATIDVVDYAEHAMGQGSQATAVAYVETVVGDGDARRLLWGVGTDANTVNTSLRAVLNACERQRR